MLSLPRSRVTDEVNRWWNCPIGICIYDLLWHFLNQTIATTDPMVKYHLYNAIAHQDFTPYSTALKSPEGLPALQDRLTLIFVNPYTLVLKNHMTITEELKTLYKSFKGICVKLKLLKNSPRKFSQARKLTLSLKSWILNLLLIFLHLDWWRNPFERHRGLEGATKKKKSSSKTAMNSNQKGISKSKD